MLCIRSPVAALRQHKKRVATVAFKENNMPPLKDAQPGSQGMPDTEDTLIGDWDPYVASIVVSAQLAFAQDQATLANPRRVTPVQGPVPRAGFVCRRAQLLSDAND